MAHIDPTTRGGAVPTGDRLIVSRSRLNRVKTLAADRALDFAQRYDVLYQKWREHSEEGEELGEKVHYAKGVTDAIALLLDPDHADPMLAELLGFGTPAEPVARPAVGSWEEADLIGAREAADERAEEVRLEAQHQAELQRDHGRLRR